MVNILTAIGLFGLSVCFGIGIVWIFISSRRKKVNGRDMFTPIMFGLLLWLLCFGGAVDYFGYSFDDYKTRKYQNSEQYRDSVITKAKNDSIQKIITDSITARKQVLERLFRVYYNNTYGEYTYNKPVITQRETEIADEFVLKDVDGSFLDVVYKWEDIHPKKENICLDKSRNVLRQIDYTQYDACLSNIVVEPITKKVMVSDTSFEVSASRINFDNEWIRIKSVSLADSSIVLSYSEYSHGHIEETVSHWKSSEYLKPPAK